MKCKYVSQCRISANVNVTIEKPEIISPNKIQINFVAVEVVSS